MAYKFLVTTDVNKVNQMAIDHQIIMVDGTVPGWQPRPIDHHFDHHRDGGADVQIDEIGVDLNNFDIQENACFVTTQLDADACVAAAWLIGLTHNTEKTIESRDKLRAIAFDCDHLVVPASLAQYSDFATKCVAAMKSGSDALVEKLVFPTDRKQWTKEMKETFASVAFENGVLDLEAAIEGASLFPGESGEADSYLENLDDQIKVWETNRLILKYRDCLVFDCTNTSGYLDPRVTLRAAKNLGVIGDEAFTVTQRKIMNKIVNDGEFLGYSYTIGVVPLHENIDKVDYVKNKVFVGLTSAELKTNPNHFDTSIVNAGLWEEWLTIEKLNRADWLCSPKIKLGWGGRKTVGGSSWNTPSKLSPQTIIDVILESNNIK